MRKRSTDKHVPIPLSVSECIQGMDDADAGDLLKAIMRYATVTEEERAGVYPATSAGRMIFPVIRNYIEKVSLIAESRVKAGASGGKAKAANAQAVQTEQEIQTVKVQPESTSTLHAVEEYPFQTSMLITEDKPSVSKQKSPRQGTYDSIIYTYTQNEELRKALQGFVESRQRLRKPMTMRALELQLMNLDRLSQTDSGKIAIVNQSVAHGWMALYGLKNETSPNGVAIGPEMEHSSVMDELYMRCITSNV